ncbi:MAG TPA: DUF2817 domain-containing protein [Rhizomicrobium sp.]
MSPEDYFPRHYRAARKAFVAACQSAGIDVISRVHPTAQGPDGKPLFLDSAAIGPRDAKKALLLISGTHGVEGYFGSGVQTGLLREGLAAPKDARIVLLHALNPYGFAWDRRVNEENVDLNRNFVDHARPPVNIEYELLKSAIAPRDISPEAMAAAEAMLDGYAQSHGAFELQDAITRGQYRHADGLFFGGARECWSAKMLRAVLGEDLARVKELTVLDFHTGLGTSGAGELIVEDLPGSAAHDRALRIWGAAARSSTAGESVSAILTGTIEQGLQSWLGEAAMTFAVLEVGTCPDVLTALRRDNWLHNFAAPDEAALAGAGIAREMRDAFYCDEPEWKRAVWRQAQNAVNAALKALE